MYNYKHSYGWECPICKISNGSHLGLFECGISHEELEGNLRFLLFMQGRDPERDEGDK